MPVTMIRSVVMCALSLLLFTQCGRKAANNSASQNGSAMQVWGYLFTRGSWQEALQNVAVNKLTDISFAFINPDEQGRMPADAAIAQAVKLAKDHQLSVYFSLGGGDPPAHLGNLLLPANRADFIRAIVSFTTTNGFDGVDVDIENDLINEHYAGFVQQLRSALTAAGKKMTAALASWNAHKISDETLQSFDRILVMSYDKTGPWNPANAGPHAPFSMLEQDFIYFSQTRKVPAARLLMGLPFYGYGFGTGAPESMNYRAIVTTYPGAEKSDSVILPGNGRIYYNGISTIQQKVMYVKTQKAGGVMIWQVLGDATDHRSLLSTIQAARH